MTNKLEVTAMVIEAGLRWAAGEVGVAENMIDMVYTSGNKFAINLALPVLVIMDGDSDELERLTGIGIGDNPQLTMLHFLTVGAAFLGDEEGIDKAVLALEKARKVAENEAK